MRLFRSLALGLALTSAALCAAFAPGNIVVVRYGDGSAALTNAGTSIFLDEYTPSGALVQTIPLPTSTSGANKRIVGSGTAATEGLMTLSADGRCLVIPGYDAAPGTASITGSTSAAVNRVIAKIDSTGLIDSTTALSDAITGSNPRSAASTNCSDLWIVGGAAGVRYASLGSATSTSVSTTVTNVRGINIFGSQLYISTASGTNPRVYAVGSGTPTTTGQTMTPLTGFSVGAAADGFFFADLNPSVPGVDTLYVADDGGSILKYSLVAGTWTSNGAITASNVHGLTGTVSGGSVTLYLTYATNLSKIAKVTDTGGYNAAPSATTVTDLVTAATNTQFRGVAFQKAGVGGA